MSTKIYTVILTASFGLMILGAVVGGFLESAGVLRSENVGSRGVAIIKLIYLGLFCLMSFAVVPLALRAFIALQVRIGNGELFLVKWFQTHEQTVVYCFWGLFVLGLGIAFSLAKDDILELLK
ncbi:MAG: hypothetical protein C4532_09865 [Candidatus Abyssobacteria bacterium SURF_17]|uniref:Uncharacterized protein n=1 Tax=Candidatus Abyssobacteria bacterium SURF_17 TaxID=2093361 RepID=A0A419EY93_9BACT|nr:MAG: hypothetical protein C4532_09865 [Candidatus Abyssubacteria bacterium SURF_17]